MQKRILIVDDQKVNRSILIKILGDEYDTVEAEDGIEALEILNRQKTDISAVLLDLVMPRLDGYGVLEETAKDPILSSIPIIVASLEDRSGMEEKALKYGARDFIVKPYNAGVLRQRLKNLIELHESNQCIIQIERDGLTGLYTKDAFCRRAEEIMKADLNTEFIIAAANIERFKLVNDSFGNQEGDKLLKFIAERMEQYVKTRRGICARSSGDRFIALVPRQAGNADFQQILEEARKDLVKYPLNMKISMKFGIYVVEDRQLPVSIMCDRAMLAAESVKGKYDVVGAYYDDAIRQRLLKEQQILDEMKGALADQQFQVYFQPKYDLTSEYIAGAEALVRWIHPELGMISPGEFIPLFERNGFITELDKYVWEKTCETIALWLKTGGRYVPVSVNVSRKDIYNEQLPEYLMELVKKYKLRPEHLHLEITETAYTEDAEQLIAVVGRLKEFGFRIEMDDFGSGYSSLNMLSELPIDILKLDMRFIQKETEKENKRSILSFVISMAKWMNLSVVAEGVETKYQIDLLRNMDCDYVQGYYYAKPMPAKDFTKEVLEGNLSVELPELKTEPQKEADEESGTDTKKKIMLIVDDIQVNRVILAECFRDQYAIKEAENGVQAYSYIQEHFDEIAIIMLDLIMPEMDGFQLLRKLEANTLYSAIPIIVTSQAGKESEIEAFRLGASDFLSKPYDSDIARHRVQNVTARVEVQALQREKQMLRKMRRLAQEAKLDQFTGVYNRMEMERQVQEYFSENPKNTGVFLMLDVDDFKVINDTFGHDIGDAAIKRVAETLLGQFREEDVISRMGGDEFAVFLKGQIEEKQLIQRLKQLLRKLNFVIETREVTCSVGVCIAPQYGGGYQELYHNADVALLTAKRLGKNRYNIFGSTTELPDRILYRNLDWLLDESSDAVVICDARNYEIYYLNDVAAKNLAKKERSECIGKPCYEAIWNHSEPCSHCVHISKMTREYCEHEVQPEGSGSCYLIKGKLIDWGSREARIQYVQDYTRHASIRQQMSRVSEDRRILLEHLPCGVFRCDAKYRKFSYVSEKMLTMLGYTREAFEEKFHNCFDNLIWKEDYEKTFAHIRELARSSSYGVSEFRVEKADGTLCWVRADGHLTEEKNGGDYYVILSDMTRQKEIEEQNRQLTEQLAHLNPGQQGTV